MIPGLVMFLCFTCRRAKLQVLDMRQVNCAYWKIRDEAGDSYCSAETFDEKQVVKVLPTYAVRQPLNVIVDLIFTSHQSETEAFFFNWAQQRKDSLQLGYTKMKIWPLPFQITREIWDIFDPESTTELELTVDWTLYS